MAATVVLSMPVYGELRAGVAVADITPPIGGEMAGYSARGKNVSTGVHDPLTARALVLDDGEDSLAIITLDLAGFPDAAQQAVRESIKKQCGIENVMVVPSHTHSGPTGDENFPSKERPWLGEAVESIVRVTAEAHGVLAPVRYGVGKGRVVEGHNRRKVEADGSVKMFWRNEERVATAPVDYEVGVIRFVRPKGKPVATLVNFTCHPVVLGPENLQFSADYPGVMRTVVEEAAGGTCLFVNGACGDINPFMDKSDPADGAFEEVEKMGRALGEEVVRVVKAMQLSEEPDPDLRVNTEVLSIGLRWDLTDPEVMGRLEEKYGKERIQAYLGRFELPMKGELVTVTLGDDLAIAGWPGEFFVQHGLDLKARSVIPNTFVFGYCNGLLGYFPTINAAWEGGYGGKSATIVEVGAGERFVNRSLINLYYQTGRLQKVPRYLP